MADTLAQKFRATNGLDAAGQKLINVALADRTVGTDGANVNYIIQENTIQQYDPTRSYVKNFSVIYGNRIWTSLQDIVKPAGDFDDTKWVNLRTDPKWIYINSGTIDLDPGQYINADSRSSELTFSLPKNPQDGDTIVVRDIGGNPGNIGISILATNQSIALSAAQIRSYNISVPFSTVTFTFSNRLWQTTVEYPSVHNSNLVSTAQNVTTQAREQIVPTGKGTFSFILPLIANDRDEVELVDIYGLIPLQHVTANAPKGFTVGGAGKTSALLKQNGRYRFIFDSANKNWDIVNEDLQTRNTMISADTTVAPNEYVTVVGNQSTTTAQTINITLPTDCEIGDFVHVSLRKMTKNQTVNIVCASDDVIQDSNDLLEFPRRSDYPNNNASTKQLSINGTTSYPGTYHLTYTENSSNKGVWYIVEVSPTVEAVDSSNDTTRARLGVVALATQAQAMIDKENNPEKERVITVETLSNRTSLENRRGIARIATQAEVSQASTASYADDIIVTPKKLNARAATETMRGLAEIATQAETNAGTDDTTIITPKKLQARQATPTMSGIAPLVTEGGVPAKAGSPRGTDGTLIYNSQDYANIVTPRTLDNLISTEESKGLVYLATENEVIAGANTNATTPIVVTPFQLHKKTATEGRIGFTQIATQAQTNAGTDDFTFVTPKKLQNRIASETLTGIARLATQSEFDAGRDDTTISTPLKIQTHFSGGRTSVNQASGLRQSGNVWSTVNFDIAEATESQRGTLRTASQSETNAGVGDNLYITPKKLQGKASSETAMGIIQIATAAETTTGTIQNKAVSPANLLNSFSVDSAWQATPNFRGTVKLTTDKLTWVGNDTDGSTQNVDNYVSDGYAISPKEMNKTLAHYLPRLATAANSLLLNGIAPDSWARRDIAQTITGAYTFTQPAAFNNTTLTKGTSTFQSGINVTGGDINVTSGNLLSNDGFHYLKLGVVGNNVANWGTYGAVFNLVNTNGNANVTTFNNGDITTIGNVYLSTDNSALVVGNNSDIALVKKNGASGKYAIGKANSFIVTQSNNNTISATDTFTDIFKVDGSGNAQVYGSLNVSKASTLTGGATIGTGLTVNGGSTVNGDVTINNSSARITGSQSWATLTAPTDDSRGYWSLDITDSKVYNVLPGYAVPTTQTDPITGIVFVTSYKYINAPGVLSQYGGTNEFTYQIWAPRAATAASGALAQTFWVRNYNPITKKFDDWGRMYTTNNPPTPGELGATSTVGTTMKNLTVQDWIQIDHIKIYADPVSRTVKFEWID